MELGLACTRFIIFIGKINPKRLCPDIRTYVIVLSRNNCSPLQKRELRNFPSYSTRDGSLFSSNVQNPIDVNVPKLFGRNSSMSGRRILIEFSPRAEYRNENEERTSSPWKNASCHDEFNFDTQYFAACMQLASGGRSSRRTPALRHCFSFVDILGVAGRRVAVRWLLLLGHMPLSIDYNAQSCW